MDFVQVAKYRSSAQSEFDAFELSQVGREVAFVSKDTFSPFLRISEFLSRRLGLSIPLVGIFVQSRLFHGIWPS